MQATSLTKTALKHERDALRRFERYLPTLRIKKQQIQRELDRARAELDLVRKDLGGLLGEVDGWAELLAEDVPLEGLLGPVRMEVAWENVAGVDVPVFAGVEVAIVRYDLERTPLWVDRALVVLRKVVELVSREQVLEERRRRLGRELRTAAQRVNLFERIKIPEAQGNIRHIAVHLGDQQTAAFGWALRSRRKATGGTA